MKKVWIIQLREQPFDFYEGGGDFYQKNNSRIQYCWEKIPGPG